MIFLAYSPLKEHAIEHSLGIADYSYYFVMKRFEPLLREFGKLIVLDEPPSDELVEQIQDKEGSCLLFSFTPPHKVPKLVSCQVIPVFAWEYSTIPYESFGQPDDNWVECLQRTRQAITHCTYTQEVVRAQLGDSYKITSIPAPLWDSYEAIRKFRVANRPAGLDALDLDCTVIDSADYEVNGTLIKPRNSATRGSLSVGEPWRGEPLEYGFGCDDDRPGMVGFNTPENWGCWAKSGYPWILLNQLLSGPVEIELSIRGYAQNVGRTLTIRVGDASESVLLGEEMETHTLRMLVSEATNFIGFEGISEPVTDGEDPRDLAVGFMRLSIRRPVGDLAGAFSDIETARAEKDGVSRSGKIAAAAGTVAEANLRHHPENEPGNNILYTSIFNPQDGRKNWEDIITAFVYAFRDCPDCTLLVKLTSQQIGSILEDIFTFFMELHPFKCRLVFIHGYLGDDEFAKLIKNSHFVVNASRGEGQCLPLMEFMSSGVPAIAPTNTAMQDYMSDKTGFIVDSSPEPTIWPHDPRQPYRTCWHRINWESLVSAFEQSRELALDDAEKYQRMSAAAVEAQRNYCSMDIARTRLKSFLGNPVN